MSPEDISKLTLGDFEAIAARLEAAAKVFRDARELLGGGGNVSQPRSGTPTAAPVVQWSPEELAKRQMALEQFPKEIQEAERRG